jgi:hypothetical protein
MGMLSPVYFRLPALGKCGVPLPNFTRRLDLMKKAIFITGCQRSGTNLLNLILDSHPQIKGVDELNLFHWEIIAPVAADQEPGEITRLLQQVS